MNDFKQIDWAGNSATRGGKRTGAGRKPSGKQTAVIRVDVELLPAIEQLKQGLNTVTDIQTEYERLLQVNEQRISERDHARIECDQLKIEVTRLESWKAKYQALTAKTPVPPPKQVICQCLTSKGDMCGKTAIHENKFNGFVVWTCERHYNTVINKSYR